MHNYFAHTPVCVLGDESKQKGILSCLETAANEGLARQQSRLAAAAHQCKSKEETFSAGWTPVPARKNVSFILSLCCFILGFRDKFKLKATLTLTPADPDFKKNKNAPKLRPPD